MRCAIACLLVGSLVMVGCNNESPKGGPGVSGTHKATTTTTTSDGSKTTTTTTEHKTDKRDTFSVKVPDGQNVTQGKNQEVTISLSRGSDFNQSVKLEIKAPKGLKVEPNNPTIKAGENSVKVLIQAEDGAAVGRQLITVVATPESGAPTSVEMPVDVKQKS